MDAGDLDQRIELQSKVVTTDALNAEVVTWVTRDDYPEVWARVRAITGRTAHIADQMQGLVSLEVEIRKGPAVTRLWRVLWKQVPLSIEAILPNDTRDGWLLLCAEGLHDGR